MSVKRYVLVLCITLLVLILEIVGGLLSGSLALLSDAGHVGIHLTEAVVALLAATLALRPANQVFSFGYHRAKTLGGYTNGLLLGLVALSIGYQAVTRLVTGALEIASGLMLGVAVIGLVGNGLVRLILHEPQAGHGHSHDLNRAALVRCVTGDLMSSVAVIGAGLLIAWQPKLTFLDPIVSLGIAGLIGYWALITLREGAVELMAADPGQKTARLRAQLEAEFGEGAIRDLHVSFAGQWLVQGQLCCPELSTATHDRLHQVKASIAAAFAPEPVHTTVELHTPLCQEPISH